jgi:radical SAM superfamily enzyme YgiQ (UPF0313 family)
LNIALINPSPTVKDHQEEAQVVKRHVTYPPMGLLYLGEILSRKGHEVKIFDQDVTGASTKEILKWLKNRESEIVGLSPLSISFDISIELADLIKKWNPNVKIIMGNILATLCSDLILKNYSSIDFCVRGEAEITLPKLVDSLEKHGKNLETIKGISYLKDGRIVMTQDRGPTEDLDAIPIPDRENLIDFDYRMGGRKFTILCTSRGCPFNCRFCAIHINSGLKGTLRTRSIPNVINELKYLEDEGYKEINFVDDCFILNKKRTLDLCLTMIKEKINLDWAAEGRVDQANIRLLRTMKKSNCKSILFGIESANQRMLDLYNKKITPEISKQAVKNAKKAMIENIIGLFVLGGPTETIKEVINTIKFSNKLDLTFIQYQYLHILMGSDLWNDLEKKGIVSRERDWKKYFRAFEILPNVLGEEILDKLMIRGYAQFLSRPKFLINQITKTIRSNYRIEMFKNSIELLTNKLREANS